MAAAGPAAPVATMLAVGRGRAAERTADSPTDRQGQQIAEPVVAEALGGSVDRLQPVADVMLLPSYMAPQPTSARSWDTSPDKTHCHVAPPLDAGSNSARSKQESGLRIP